MINYPCFAHCSTELSSLSPLSAGGSVQKWMLCVTKHWASHNRCMSLRHLAETPPPHHGKARVLSFDWQNPWETKYFLWEWMVCLAINITPVQPKRHRRKSHCSTIQPVIPLCMSGNLQATLFSTGWHWGPAFSVHIIDAFKKIKC